MKFIVHANGVPWQQEYLPRFVEGLASKGHAVVHSATDVADETGINIIFANNSWKLTHQQCVNKKIPLITVGRCFFGDRHDMVAIGWDGFNGCADFCLDETMPPHRWIKHGGLLHEPAWNPEGYVLVCGEFREIPQWYATLREILAGEDVRFRAHPFRQGHDIPGWKIAPAAGQDDIASLFPDCKAVITYDSIAGCDAVLNGCPSIAWGQYSMARDVSWTSWREFPKDIGAFTRDVAAMSFENWANRLAYCQWSHDEITAGDWWDHLEDGLTTRLERADEHHHLSHTTKMRKHHRLVDWKGRPENSRLPKKRR